MRASGFGAPVVASVLLIVASARASQAQAGTAVIDGAVTDSSMAPLGDATAWLLGSKLEVVTGGNGRFRIERLPAGRYLLLVRHVGFAPVSTAVQVAEGDTALALRSTPFASWRTMSWGASPSSRLGGRPATGNS